VEQEQARAFALRTLKAGLSSTLPLTLTRPSAIQRSASRREQRPARAITLAMRSPSGVSAGLSFSLLSVMRP
jgi:hypothetical protein